MSLFQMASMKKSLLILLSIGGVMFPVEPDSKVCDQISTAYYGNSLHGIYLNPHVIGGAKMVNKETQDILEHLLNIIGYKASPTRSSLAVAKIRNNILKKQHEEGAPKMTEEKNTNFMKSISTALEEANVILQCNDLEQPAD